ncbi:hypothetical protein [Miltoncostaea marina]|uniref:hypothetical protein n=1 Tax=Miltoncostaea marina TaxID=2843215 RepID=UPI001C3C8A19|nr:hypothetical protein [Miltoncostaea marina]
MATTMTACPRVWALVGIGAALALALGAPAAHPATSGAEVTITAGSLSLAASDFQPLAAALTGAEQVLPTTPASPWTVVDARGTGAPWSVVATATDLVSPGTPARVIPSSAIAITTGPVAAGAGADPATGIAGATGAAFTAPTGPGQTDVAVLAAPGPHRGAFTFTPRLDVTIPADAMASHAGAPYATTLTLTIS